MGVATLAAIGLLGLGNTWAALAAGVAAAAAAVAAMIWRYGAPDRQHQMEGRRFGRGPYVSCPCSPNADLLARLADIVQRLRQAAVAENWPVDWTVFERCLTQTAAATQANNLVDAAREYLRAIISLMDQVRQRRTTSSDSGVILQ